MQQPGILLHGDLPSLFIKGEEVILQGVIALLKNGLLCNIGIILRLELRDMQIRMGPSELKLAGIGADVFPPGAAKNFMQRTAICLSLDVPQRNVNR